MDKMNHIGLFEGIGGFSIAARKMGWKTVAWCEWKEFCQTVLKYHFPKAEGFGDITKTDFTKYANKIDILTGGFPCQPYSLAGKRKGKEDERHLWPEMLRAIREIRPTYVVGENVGGIVSWNGGLVFEEVHTDLEAEGYEVQAFILPACGKDAPHRRERVWFVAYSNNIRGSKSKESGEQQRGAEIRGSGKKFSNDGLAPDSSSKRRDNRSNNRQERHIQGDERIAEENKSERDGRKRRTWEVSANASDTLCEGLRECERISSTGKGRKSDGHSTEFNSGTAQWENFPTQSPICGGNDGLPTELDGITFPKWRNESIMAYGNAIVPQVAFEIFKAIESMELHKKIIYEK